MEYLDKGTEAFIATASGSSVMGLHLFAPFSLQTEKYIL